MIVKENIEMRLPGKEIEPGSDVDKMEEYYDETIGQEAVENKSAIAFNKIQAKNETETNMVILYLKEFDKYNKQYEENKYPWIKAKLDNIATVVMDLSKELPEIDGELKKIGRVEQYMFKEAVHKDK